MYWVTEFCAIDCIWRGKPRLLVNVEWGAPRVGARCVALGASQTVYEMEVGRANVAEAELDYYRMCWATRRSEVVVTVVGNYKGSRSR